MRKKIGICGGAVAVIVLLAVMAVPALAAWVDSMRVETQVQEPISCQGMVEVPVEIYPGESFSFGGEVYNDAPVSYGLRYYGYLWWTWKTGEEVEILLENGEVSFSTKGGGPQNFGTINVWVNGLPYSPGALVNIEPGATHEIKVLVTPSPALEPGHLAAEIVVIREAPIPVG